MKLLAVPELAATQEIAVTNAAALAKAALLQVAFTITKIEDEKDRDFAIREAAKIKGHIDAVEGARKAVKKPFWDVGVAIDSAANEHVAELTKELRRMNALIGGFEADRKAAAEKTERELRAQQQAVVNQPVPKDKGEALKQELESEEKAVEIEGKIEQIRQTNDATAPKGGAMRVDYDITVTDIKALYAAHPQCVELKPRYQAIKDLLKIGTTPAGVQAIKKAAYNVRGAAPKTLT